MNIEDIIDRRRETGEIWVALAGVPFRVQSRFYGVKKATILRTTEGKAFRLVDEPGFEILPKGLSYMHDVIIDEASYHVFVAPADSQIAKTLQTEPVEAGHGSPVLLRRMGDGDGGAFAIRRVPPLDGKPLEIPPAGDEVPPRLLADIEVIAKNRGWPVEVAKVYLLDQAVKRYRTLEKFEKKRSGKTRPKK